MTGRPVFQMIDIDRTVENVGCPAKPWRRRKAGLADQLKNMLYSNAISF